MVGQLITFALVKDNPGEVLCFLPFHALVKI